MPKWKLDRCAACGAEAVMQHAGREHNKLEYWAECTVHPQKHRTSCCLSAREAAQRWNARQKTLRAYKPTPHPALTRHLPLEGKADGESDADG